MRVTFKERAHVTNRMRGILITGFFRTGSTFVFSSLRVDSRLCCYYEPYHPLMTEYLFADESGGRAADADLLGHTVDGDYFREYRKIDACRLQPYLRCNERSTNHPVLAGSDSGGQLKGYIDFLIDEAERAGKFPVLQCNRWNLVLPWLKKRYPDFIITLITRPTIPVVFSLYALARREGEQLDLLSTRANYWGIDEIIGNIVSFYDFKSEIIGKFNYFQKIHFILRFSELYMSQSADITLNYDQIGYESSVFLDQLERGLDIRLSASREYFTRFWRQGVDECKIAESVRDYFELPETILAAWGQERSVSHQ